MDVSRLEKLMGVPVIPSSLMSIDLVIFIPCNESPLTNHLCISLHLLHGNYQKSQIEIMESALGDRQPHVVIFPLAGVGHMRPTAELARRLCAHHVSVTILAAPFHYVNEKTAAIVNSLADQPLIRIHNLPDGISISEEEAAQQAAPLKVEKRIDLLMEKSKPHVQNALSHLLSSSPLSAFITDLFCTTLFDVTSNLNIPTYVFFPSNATLLSVMLALPRIVSETDVSFNKAPEYTVRVDGIGFELKGQDMPSSVMDRSNTGFEFFVRHSGRLSMADGILINTFEDAEPRALKALRERGTPKVYAIGPALSVSLEDEKIEQESERAKRIMEWLDRQPPKSVVFVSFGSGGKLTGEQLTELAVGLEASGERFLWVLREPSDTQFKGTSITGYPELNAAEIVPEGFLMRTAERGMVVSNWAPQQSVLSHPSTGGFVTHCGWNSSTESIWNGVPMVTWPLFAEQRMNRLLLIKEIGVAVDLDMDINGFVKAERVESAVKELMCGEEGRKAREKAQLLMVSARSALADGGSSVVALSQLVALWSTK